MKVIKRLIPVVLITTAIMFISFFLYGEIMERGRAKCWQELESTAQFVKREIKSKFKDESAKLNMLRMMISQYEYFDKSDIGDLHLEFVSQSTVFSRIGVLYPDDTYISNEINVYVGNDFSFADVAAGGERLTTRKTDSETGKQYIYYIVPVVKNDQTILVLIGEIDVKTLLTFFDPMIYDGQANICVIDVEDGSYIVDNWHDELGNAFQMVGRKMLKGYEDFDMEKVLRNLETASVAFESKTTGKPIYMYSMPADVYDWQISIFAQEDVIFGYLMSLQRLCLFVGIAESIILILYFVWNIRIVALLEKSIVEVESQREKLRELSYFDMLTAMYNRNKYIVDCDSLKNRESSTLGIAYIDLNGLKQINDTQNHTAGDDYIRRTAKIISGIFPLECYRIGGDEFVVLSVGAEQQSFNQKTAALIEAMEAADISVSVGAVWSENSSSPESVITLAEKQMYVEKARYYTAKQKQR